MIMLKRYMSWKQLSSTVQLIEWFQFYILHKIFTLETLWIICSYLAGNEFKLLWYRINCWNWILMSTWSWIMKISLFSIPPGEIKWTTTYWQNCFKYCFPILITTFLLCFFTTTISKINFSSNWCAHYYL